MQVQFWEMLKYFIRIEYEIQSRIVLNPRSKLGDRKIEIDGW